ncbi:hypothetical protein IF650_03300 [Cellulosimicrobium terreum]|nr:hypothetical protein [Cellulosimicrobium terreum]
MTHDEPTTRPAVQPVTVTIAAATTLAWYAVPDVVRPRWARAVLKAAIGVAGAVLTVGVTPEGRQAREGVRLLRETARSVGEPSGATEADGAEEDNTFVPDPVEGPPLPVPPLVLAAGAVASVAASVALIVAGEKWVYRRGESLRSRGARLPHTRVGLAMAGVAVMLTAAEPFLWRDADDTSEG